MYKKRMSRCVTDFTDSLVTVTSSGKTEKWSLRKRIYSTVNWFCLSRQRVVVLLIKPLKSPEIVTFIRSFDVSNAWYQIKCVTEDKYTYSDW